MAKKTQATSKSGTTYTTRGNSKFYWENGEDSGMIDTITPSNSYYNLYMGNGNFPEQVPFSQDGYNAHLNNIRGLEFKEPKSFWEELKEVGSAVKQGILNKLKNKKQNGGTLTTLQKDTLLKHISGF